MTPHFDPGLYAILDLPGTEPAVPIDSVEAALEGGVSLLQIRAKSAPPAILYGIARQVGRLAKRHRVPLILNDRADVAMASGAEGVHLGRSDLPAGAVRRIWPEGLIGASVHDMSELTEVTGVGVDYVAAGCLFPTVSKRDAVPLDVEVFRSICRESRLPVFGIGGITVERAQTVKEMGASGIAVIHGLWSAPDVRARAREYRAAFTS